MSVLTLVLAGGPGCGLSILSAARAKPAQPFGGKYRLIDFVLSNVANSGLSRVALLAQARVAAGDLVAPEAAAPLYVRNKVALTTAERRARQMTV